jgi:CheY-like chemotaxis protein
MRILVVDDEPSIRRSIRAFLEDEGFTVRTTVSGEEGLQLLAAERFDGVIVDMRLPGMDGNTFILQAYRMQPVLIFLIYTGSVGYVPPPELEAIGIRPEATLRKPLHDLAVLSTRLHTIRDERRQP